MDYESGYRAARRKRAQRRKNALGAVVLTALGSIFANVFPSRMIDDLSSRLDAPARRAAAQDVAPVHTLAAGASTAPLADNQYVQFAAISAGRIDEVARKLQEHGLPTYVENVQGKGLKRIVIPYTGTAHHGIIETLRKIDPTSTPQLIVRTQGKVQPQQYVPSLDEAITQHMTSALTAPTAAHMLQQLEQPRPSLYNLYVEMPFSTAQEGMQRLNELRNAGYDVFADDDPGRLAVQFRTDAQLDDLMAYAKEHGKAPRLVWKRPQGESIGETPVRYKPLPKDKMQRKHDLFVQYALKAAAHYDGSRTNHIRDSFSRFTRWGDSIDGAEGDFNHYRGSVADAVGIGQVRALTATAFAREFEQRSFTADAMESMLWDFDTNVRYNTYAKAEAWQQAKGDERKAAIIYNRGYTNAQKKGPLPKETQTYIKRVNKYMQSFSQRMHEHKVTLASTGQAR